MRRAFVALVLLAAGCVRTHRVAETGPYADVAIELIHLGGVPRNALVHDAVTIDGALVVESSDRATRVFTTRVLPRPTHYEIGTEVERPCLGPPRRTWPWWRYPIELGTSSGCIAPFSRSGSSRALGSEALSACSTQLDQTPVEGASYRVRYRVEGDRCAVTCERILGTGVTVRCGAGEPEARGS